jgi:hypothetical protein
MTDKTIKTAYTVNGKGHILKIYRRDDGSVWATFRLNEQSTDVLGQKLPMYRIDKTAPIDLDSARQSPLPGLRTFEAEPKWVNFRIFHGEGPANTGALRRMMEGTQIVFRYSLFTGGYKETTFDLRGAKEAIAAALDIPAEVDAAAASREQERKTLLREAANRCNAKGSAKAKADCYSRGAECMRKAPDDNEAFRRCLAE